MPPDTSPPGASPSARSPAPALTTSFYHRQWSAGAEEHPRRPARWHHLRRMEDRLHRLPSRSMRAPEPQPAFRPKSSATLLKASLGSGTLGLQYKMQMAGWDAAALAHSATAETEFTWTGGALRISPDGKPPARAHRRRQSHSRQGLAGPSPPANGRRPPASISSAAPLRATPRSLWSLPEQNGAVTKVTGTLLQAAVGQPSSAAHAGPA